jgi:hypothetical protein
MSVQDFSALNKAVFGDAPPTLIPDVCFVQKDIDFEQGSKLGDFYEQPVRLALPSGFTRALGNGTAGGFTLNGARAGTQKKAKVYGTQIVLQEQVAYEDLAKAASQGQQAYKAAMGFMWEGMQLAMRKQLEIMCLYGNVGISKVGSYTSATPSITIGAADFAPQIWGGMEGALVEIMNGTSSTVRDTPVSIVSVDLDTRIVTLSGTVSGAAANDIVYFKGGYGKEMNGLAAMAANTGSLFEISATTYNNWKWATHSVGGAMSFQALKKGLAKGVNKGLAYPINIYLSTGAVDDLIGDIHQLRTVTKEEVKRIELGADEVEYNFCGVKAHVKAHPMIKNGHGLGVVKQFAKRLGAMDFGFGMPGRPDGKVFFDLETAAAIEARAYTHQAIFSEMPGVNLEFTSITNRTT